MADIDKLGLVLVKGLHVFNAIEMMVIGVQLFMCIYCLALHLETSKAERKRRLPYIIFNFVIFALSAVQAFIGSQVQFTREFDSHSGRDVVTRSRSLASTPLYVAAMVCSCVVIFLADGLMFYRCYIIRYSDPLWLRALPGLLYVPSIAFGILTICTYTQFNNGVMSWPQPTFYCFTVAFNILVTVLIAQRLIRKRRELRTALPGRDTGVYTGVTAVIVESAWPLTIFGIGYAILSAMSITGPGNPYVGITFLNSFDMLYRLCNQLSPTLIIFRVTTGRSWTNDFNQTMGQRDYPGEDRPGTLKFHHTTQDPQDLASFSSSK